jgi:Ca2+-binding EF-hand superfamily protein
MKVAIIFFIKLKFKYSKMTKNKKISQKKKNYEYLKIFMEFDLDSSGGVDKHEIIKVLKACGI